MMPATGRSGAGNPAPAAITARLTAATTSAVTRRREHGRLTRVSIPPCARLRSRLRRGSAAGQTVEKELPQAPLHLFGHLHPTGVGGHRLRLTVRRQISAAGCARFEMFLELLDVSESHLALEVLEDDTDQLLAVHRIHAVTRERSTPPRVERTRSRLPRSLQSTPVTGSTCATRWRVWSRSVSEPSIRQNCFGRSSPTIRRVSSRSRVPSPPARMTAVQSWLTLVGHDGPC